MRILYDATPLLMRSAGVKNYHHSLLTHLVPILEPHQVDLFPLLQGLPPNNNEGSNYGSLATKIRLGGVVASNYSGIAIPSQLATDADVFHLTPFVRHPPKDVPLTSTVGLARQTYNLPDHYVLFVGAMEPRKNLTNLVRAYSLLSPDLRRRHPLVVTGATGWKNKEIRKQLGAVGAHLTGYVRRALLPALYHGASLFVLPSFYEGFGMPLLEAMAARVPVVTSDVSAMPEVAGEAALYADPHDVESIADAMERVLQQTQLATALGEAGRRRARLFTWHETAVDTKAFFEGVIGG